MVSIEMLNENQKKAVLTSSQYVRIIAGAGSGKTRVLTMRIAHLIEQCHVWPNKILAITFTNKAANEMKERIRQMLPEQGNAVFISTIHSLCVRILREDIPAMGMPRNFTVMDADDQRSILKEAYKEFGLDKQTYTFGSMLDYIANNKAAEISPERAYVFAGDLRGENDKAKVYEYYVNRQQAIYALDFDDLLLYTVRMFRQFAEIQANWVQRFHYIHVDEFQDIDKIQYDLIQLLAGNDNSVYVVGDPDQTIYTWRGADVNIIMNFEKDYQPCETIVLNENYRSTPSILNGANALIHNNRNRVEKDLFTSRPDNGAITHYSSAGEEYEATWIACKINELHKQGQRYRDCAILYRSNYLSRALEKAMIEQRIPYVIYGGIKFYERAEIKDALCYLRMVCGSNDLALMRIINVPRRGLGNKTMDTIVQRARETGKTMYEVIRDEKVVSGKAQTTIDNFVKMVEKWKNLAPSTPISRLLEMILLDSGYRSMLEADKENERLENLKELITDIESYTVNYPDSSLEEYLQLVSLYGDKGAEDGGDHVQLMTVHAAKGLEFDTVFVYGMSEGIFPNDRAMQESQLKGLEEERRLAYVAFTRAQNKLYLTESSGFSYILSRIKVPSRFIKEIDPQYIEHIGATFDTGKPKEIKLHSALFEDEAPFEERLASKPRTKWKKGDHVRHAAFGEGIVLEYSEGMLKIAFAFPFGVRKIMATHPSIQKAEEVE